MVGGGLVPSRLVHRLERSSSLLGHPPCVVVVVWVGARGAANSPAPPILNAGPRNLFSSCFCFNQRWRRSVQHPCPTSAPQPGCGGAAGSGEGTRVRRNSRPRGCRKPGGLGLGIFGSDVMKKLCLLGDRTDVGQANWKQRAERTQPWLSTARGSGVSASRSGPCGRRGGLGQAWDPLVSAQIEGKPRRKARGREATCDTQGWRAARLHQHQGPSRGPPAGAKKRIFREWYEVTASRYELSLLLTTQARRYTHKYIKN